METKEIIATREWGLEKGYLQEKEVWLKPLASKSQTLTPKDQRNSIHSFMYEGATVEWCVPQNERADLQDPFKGNENERKYFELLLGLDLKITASPTCYWTTSKSKVRIVKDSAMMALGVRYDMSNPEDVLRVKILSMQREIAPNWDATKEGNILYKPHYRWALVDDEIVDNSKKQELDLFASVYKHWGSISENKDKMKQFLALYIMNTKAFKVIPDNAPQSFFEKEIGEIIEKDKKGYLDVVNDENKAIKLLIMEGVAIGEILKLGVNAYSVPGGDGIKRNLDELVTYLKLAKEASDDVYLKIQARLDMIGKVEKTKGK